MHRKSGFFVLVVNVNASQMGVFVDKLAIIGFVSRQQFWLVYFGCFDGKCELVVDRLKT